jgi:hypothetical protein
MKIFISILKCKKIQMEDPNKKPEAIITNITSELSPFPEEYNVYVDVTIVTYNDDFIAVEVVDVTKEFQWTSPCRSVFTYVTKGVKFACHTNMYTYQCADILIFDLLSEDQNPDIGDIPIKPSLSVYKVYSINGNALLSILNEEANKRRLISLTKSSSSSSSPNTTKDEEENEEEEEENEEEEEENEEEMSVEAFST